MPSGPRGARAEKGESPNGPAGRTCWKRLQGRGQCGFDSGFRVRERKGAF